ncbi:MAG TPA: M28 family peptidase [Bacteroidia bacterium]|jgi:glutaminyl-peptide cyclotransferase|nr:M28 family peptidase [Bacteroidia bacterium]
MKERSKYLRYITTGLAVLLLVIAFSIFITGCKSNTHPAPTPTVDTTKSQPVNSTLPSFNADSAYKFTKEQVDFGPRIPGTKAHEKCLQFIVSKLKAEGLAVSVQKSTAKTFDGKTFEFENITGSSQPDNKRRILLCTHWDTRPFADADSIDPKGTFDGACDGASGVATLLELGRHLKDAKVSVGVDLVFFDIEDYGQQGPEDGNYPEMKDSWCLGSQYWAKNIPPGYAPLYGILLDMVGGKNAVFPMEGTSMHYAPDVVRKIWDIADKLGYSATFTRDATSPTTDDHLYINEIANIPTIDIVHYEVTHGDYPYFHHRHSDNMSVIDTATLHIVGRTLMNVIYQE